MNFLVLLAWFMKWNKNGSLRGISGFLLEGVRWDLGPIFQMPCGKVLAQVGPLNMVWLRSTWSAATMLYNNSSFWSWPIASISTTWVSLKSDTLAWVFNHAVWGPGAGSRERVRRGEWDSEREIEIDVKRRAESEKDCSGRGNGGLNSDEIIQFVSWQNRQTERWAAATEQQPPGDLKMFRNRPHPPYTFDCKINYSYWCCMLRINIPCFIMLHTCGWNCLVFAATRSNDSKIVQETKIWDTSWVWLKAPSL